MLRTPIYPLITTLLECMHIRISGNCWEIWHENFPRSTELYFLGKSRKFQSAYTLLLVLFFLRIPLTEAFMYFTAILSFDTKSHEIDEYTLFYCKFVCFVIFVVNYIVPVICINISVKFLLPICILTCGKFWKVGRIKRHIRI